MRDIFSRVPVATVLVLFVMIGSSQSFAQELKTADEQSKTADGQSKTADGQSKTALKKPANPASIPLLFPQDDESEAVESKTDVEIKKDLLGKIPAATRNQFRNNVLPAMQSGAKLAFLSAMEKLISMQTPESIAALETYCQATGVGSLRDRFTKVLIEGIEQGLPVNAQKLVPVFAQYTSDVLISEIESELNELGQHEIMQDPLASPAGWQDSDELFWEVHVWKNRFLNLNRLVQYSVAINQPTLKQALKEQDQDEIDRLQKPSWLGVQVQSKFDEMLEREAELRLFELAKAETVLRTEDDFEQRLYAAFSLEMHGGELENFFKNRKPGLFGRPMLNDQEQLAKAVEGLKSGREHGKDVIEKAVLLRVGAHWWLRGRYGMGSMAQGLLKPEQAMRSPELMFGLFMPKERPQAIGYYDEQSGDVAPGYERRHYFTWAVERRDLFTNRSSKRYTDRGSKITGTSASHFW